MILLWGLPTDEPLARVRRELKDDGVDHVLLDQQDIADTTVALNTALSNGELSAPGIRIDLDQITAAYIRPFDLRQLFDSETPGPAGEVWDQARETTTSLLTWLNATRAPVVNRPRAMASNGSKPYQARLIGEAGFKIPDTLLTTDPKAVDQFWDQHGEVIYKSISGVRSIVRRLAEADRERLGDVEHGPTQFQRYIRGTEVRVHVVGNDIFATTIESDADDYWYPGEAGPPTLSATDLPDEIEVACLRLTERLGLAVAGIDLRHGDDGYWYCFEVNPSPGYTYYEDVAGQPIARSIASLLGSPAQSKELAM